MSLLKKVSKVIVSRPTKVLSYARQYWLFFRTYWLSQITVRKNPRIKFHENVRLQRLSTVSVEPEALIILGSDTIVYENAKIEAYGRGVVDIGAQSIIGDAIIQSRLKIKIGKNFLTSWNVYICDFDPHPVDVKLRELQIKQMVHRFSPSFEVTMEKVNFFTKADAEKNLDYASAEIEIGDNVWVGANVSILKGAKIGNGCVIATGAVVLKGEYPEKSILAGNPAKVVKTIL